MAFFWKKQKEIETSIENYLNETELCFTAFGEAFNTYLDEGPNGKFEQLVEDTHLHESRSDDKRREIERLLYGKALIPELRGDILGMLESVDKVPNKCESVLYQILFEKVAIPEEYRSVMTKLVAKNIESCRILCEAVHNLFSDAQQVASAGSRIDERESESDRIEHELIKSIFSSEGDKADKILLRDLILAIGSISDRAENAADRLTIIAIKHQV